MLSLKPIASPELSFKSLSMSVLSMILLKMGLATEFSL